MQPLSASRASACARTRARIVCWALAALWGGWVAGAANLPSATPLLPPFPKPTAISCSFTEAPQAAPTASGLLLAAPFSPGVDRIYWDIPMPRMPSEATTLLLELTYTNPIALRAVSVHLKSGPGWHSSESVPLASADRHTLAFPRATFRSENDADAWSRARTVRLSLWKQESQPAGLTLHTVSVRRDIVAIVRATEVTAPREADFAHLLAARVAAALTKGSIPFTIIDDTDDGAWSSFRLIILPWSPDLSGRHVRKLERFVRSGGKVIVYYNGSTELAHALGIKLDPWRSAPEGEEWTAWQRTPSVDLPLPPRVPHATANLRPPYPDTRYSARIIATWTDAAGRATEIPACVLTSRGAWFAHVPPLASRSAADFLRSVVTRLIPEMGAVYATDALRAAEGAPYPETAFSAQTVSRMRAAQANKQPALVAKLAADLRDARAAVALASGPCPLPSEVRGVWADGSGRHPRGWDGLFTELGKHGVNTVYAHMQSAGFSHLKTGAAAPLSPRGQNTPARALEAALAAAKRNNLALHAWVTCWTLDGAGKAQVESLSTAGRLMRDAHGTELPWLCPSLPDNHAHLLAGIALLAQQGVAGIHLDYVRYPDAQGCFAPATRKAFEQSIGTSVPNWPQDVQPGGPLAHPFQAFRQQEITRFVQAASATARAINPAIIISAAVFPSPETARARGQDWPRWLREKTVDAVCPMAYTENTATFGALLDACIRETPDPTTQLFPGIGTGSDRSQLDALGTAEQILALRSRNLPGFVFFAADDELLGRILPPLRLGGGGAADAQAPAPTRETASVISDP